MENKLVLCSAKDKFVLTQDICVMCGSIGIDQEGCLISCAQCGQCYHPYCLSLKVTKVILQKGWRCLDCVVCEGCGERNDDGRLILCDNCDISYHIYCMDPPLDCVPQGTWKCKWCAQCQTCGSNDPGINSSWQKNYTQCGPCASHTECIACHKEYTEGDLIIQCVQCERWLHCICDNIKSEEEAEKCAEDGYNCVLCRPRDVPPPHLANNPMLTSFFNSLSKPAIKYSRSPPPMPISRSPELYKASTQQYLLDGVYLSETGLKHIKSLTSECQQVRKKRRKLAAGLVNQQLPQQQQPPPQPMVLPLPQVMPVVVDKEADIMATIESVVAGNSQDNSLELSEQGKLTAVELSELTKDGYGELKEGMVWTPRPDQPPPEGYSIYTTENGVTVLRRKRQRNLQKLGIGGFHVRLRGMRKDKDDEAPDEMTIIGMDDKPRRKPQRRKPKTKLSECFPLYMQEAFFGKTTLDKTKDNLDSSSGSDSEVEKKKSVQNSNTIQLSQDEIQAMQQIKAKQEKEPAALVVQPKIKREQEEEEEQVKMPIDDDASDTEALGDILPISGDLLDSELVNTIMNEPEQHLAKPTNLEQLDNAPASTKDDLTDILSPHFNLDSMVRDTAGTSPKRTFCGLVSSVSLLRLHCFLCFFLLVHIFVLHQH